jgi:hypothetical protein
MDSKQDPYFEVEGVFFTYQDGPIIGYASTSGDAWHIITESGDEFYRGTIYLDRAKRVNAPRNLHQKKWSSKRIDDLVEEYQLIYDSLTADVTMLKLDYFKMKLFMAETYLIEYKSLKYSYFAGNALKFILF